MYKAVHCPATHCYTKSNSHTRVTHHVDPLAQHAMSKNTHIIWGTIFSLKSCTQDQHQSIAGKQARDCRVVQNAVGACTRLLARCTSNTREEMHEMCLRAQEAVLACSDIWSCCKGRVHCGLVVWVQASQLGIEACSNTEKTKRQND